VLLPVVIQVLQALALGPRRSRKDLPFRRHPPEFRRIAVSQVYPPSLWAEVGLCPCRECDPRCVRCSIPKFPERRRTCSDHGPADYGKPASFVSHPCWKSRVAMVVHCTEKAHHAVAVFSQHARAAACPRQSNEEE
jgi:hypothetical protein